ncbi:MAG TPA: amidohydrolase family protein [Chthoniobacterales bacterium]
MIRTKEKAEGRGQKAELNRSRHCRCAASILFLFFAVTAFASDEIPAPPQNGPILLKNATIHPVSSPDLPNADILIANGRIASVGPGLVAPAGAAAIDATGKHIYPGLIAAASSIGLEEIDAVRSTVDAVEAGDINPNARAEISVNPDSEIIPVTRSNGILVALAVPRTSGLLAGTSALIELDGWTWEQMTLRAPVGLHLKWPDTTIRFDPKFPKSPDDQRKTLAKNLKKLEDAFHAARAYAAAKKAKRSDFQTDLRWEAMIPVLEGKVPVIIEANNLTQITAAVDFAIRERLKMILLGGEDASLAIDLLKTHQIPVILTSAFDIPSRRQDGYDAAYSTAARLQAAGVPFCISTSGSDARTPHLRNLPYQAGMAAAFGLPKDEALKSVTLYPAQILGVADRLGSLDPGKDATLFITNGDPLEATTTVESAYIEGRQLDLANRQTRLRDKYLQKYKTQ